MEAEDLIPNHAPILAAGISYPFAKTFRFSDRLDPRRNRIERRMIPRNRESHDQTPAMNSSRSRIQSSTWATPKLRAQRQAQSQPIVKIFPMKILRFTSERSWKHQFTATQHIHTHARAASQRVHPQKTKKKQSIAARARDSSTVMTAHSTSSTTKSNSRKLPAVRCEKSKPGHRKTNAGSEKSNPGHRKEAAAAADHRGHIGLGMPPVTPDPATVLTSLALRVFGEGGR